ncbi:EAL domain-containing protein [Paraburkholderia strydomiana]
MTSGLATLASHISLGCQSTASRLTGHFCFGVDRDPRKASVVQAAISLGHNLGLTVLAEGVESTAQRDWLATLNCDEIQGYLYGRPVPAKIAESFLKRCGFAAA